MINTLNEEPAVTAEESSVSENAADIEKEIETESETEKEINTESDTEKEIETATDMKESDAKESTPKKKKARILQWPVLVCIGLVLASLLGYFCYTAFFLREPDGKFFWSNVVWENEIDGATYYYEFKSDGNLNVYIGSIEYNTHFEKQKTKDGNKLGVDIPIGNFYSTTTTGYADYTISGSRILGNQEFKCSYGEEEPFTLKQAANKKSYLQTPELPEEVNTDDDLTGTWTGSSFTGEEYKAEFKDDGTMSWNIYSKSADSSVTYNGVYTIEDSTINFTFTVTENVSVPLDYAINGDHLYFMGLDLVREGSDGSEATPDE